MVQTLLQIEFFPPGKQGLARAIGAKDGQLKRPERQAGMALKYAHEFRNIGVGHCRVVTARQAIALRQDKFEVTLPGGRIVTLPVPLNLGDVQDGLDVASQQAGRGRLVDPYWP
jgi:hypothetical protein